MGGTFRVLRGAAALLLATACSSTSTPIPTPGAGAPSPADASPTTTRAIGAGVVPLSSDDRGAPRLVRAVRRLAAPPGATPEQAARAHLRALAPIYGAPPSRVSDARLGGVVALRRGAAAVTLQQEIGGVPVLGGDVRVLLQSDGALAGVAGTLVSAQPPRPTFAISEADALAAALRAEYAVATAPRAAARAASGWTPLTVPPVTGLDVSEAHVRRVMAQDGRALVPAYHVEYFATAAGGVADDALRFVIAASDGRVLERVDLTAADSFTYRVWADPDGARRPLDGPHQDTQPHPTGLPDGFVPAAVAPALVAVESLNGPGDPWLPDGATESVGNNVDAYVDLVAPDGLSGTDFRAAVTAPGVFDHVYDLALPPMADTTQQQASAIGMFYTINWLHDWFYDSGFTEAAFNAQASNYGRGGLENDSMRAEAQDNAPGGSRNNANMSTPADGLRPRMQMFLWSGSSERHLTIQGDGVELATNTAAFGPTSFDLIDDLVLTNDGSTDGTGGTLTDGCQPPVVPVAGQILLVDRGACNFNVKAANAQAAGAVGVVVANNVAASTAPGLGGVDPTITIPVLSTTLDGGNDLKARLLSGPVSLRMHRLTGVEIDGAFDAGIVAHEWGHYFHHRLSDCNTTQCGALSEGWGDFVALHTALEPGDDWTAVFSGAPYATRGISAPNSTYFGIRRYPYSIDRSKSPLTFRHIQRGEPLPAGVPRGPNGTSDNAEVHNAGEVWTAMLWDVYVGLLEEHGFDDARRRMSDYMVAGLLMSPRDATFTDARDGILAAVSALEPDDLGIVAAGFAARGNGSCAVAPGPLSTDFVGVIESDDLAGRIAVGGVALLDDDVSCDDDGYLDPGEIGTLHLTVANGGAFPLTSVAVSAVSATEGIEPLEEVEVGTLAPFSSVEVAIPVKIGLAVPVDSPLALTITTTADNACDATVALPLDGATGRDDVLTASTHDDVEATESPWTPGGAVDEVWRRAADATGGHFLHGVDLGSPSDTFLVSPVLEVSATEPLVVTLQHAYSFEADPTTLYDGGFIEVSTDDGATWVDATTLTTTPIAYTGALSSCCQNPLAGRAVFSRASAGFPARSELVLDFGTNLADRDIQLRFRIATDAAVSGYGWEIDDVDVEGIDNTPFPEVVEEGPTCQVAPIADAGADQQVSGGLTVQLGGAASDPNGEAVTVAWSQLAGPAITLLGASTLTPTFTAPTVDSDTTLTFRLTVSDSFGSATDDVDVLVGLGDPAPDAGAPPDADLPPPEDASAPVDLDAEPAPEHDAATEPPDDGDGGGCGCRTDGRGGLGGLALMLGAVALALRRSAVRRR